MRLHLYSSRGGTIIIMTGVDSLGQKKFRIYTFD